MLSSVLMMAQLALEVEGGAQKTISPSEFQKMPRQTLTVTNPHSKKQEKYEGVPLRVLLDQVAVPAGISIPCSCSRSERRANSPKGGLLSLWTTPGADARPTFGFLQCCRAFGAVPAASLSPMVKISPADEKPTFSAKRRGEIPVAMPTLRELVSPGIL
jgi:hypothetical protein